MRVSWRAELWAISYKVSHICLSKVAESNYETIIRGLLNKPAEIKPKSIRLPNVDKELADIDNMDGYKFKKYCSNLLKLTGLFAGGTIYFTENCGDFGVM